MDGVGGGGGGRGGGRGRIPVNSFVPPFHSHAVRLFSPALPSASTLASHRELSAYDC